MVDAKGRPPPPKPPPMRSKPAAPIASDEPPARSSKLGWILGWVILPLVLISLLFFGGVHVGAQHPDMALSRAMLWMFDREPQLGPETDEDRQPMARRIRLAVLPRKDHSFEVDVTQAQLDAIAKAANVAPDKLECEAVCRALWIEKYPDREFLGASDCKLTPPKKETPGPTKLECDAKVQR